MRLVISLAAAVVAATLAQPAAAAGCDGTASLAPTRIVEIDAATGPLYGDISRQIREDRFLAPKEVVLTFDDGPMPWITKSILDTLDAYCTKATFFSVGRMALAYPASVRDVLARGHTLGTHTWSHPLNLPALKAEKAREEIEKGFAAVALAAGEPIAPFFRFPGLSDNAGLLTHLQGRGIATFTVDVVSNDSFIGDPARLVQRTLREVEARNGGIMLFHDIKAATAKALPAILAGLQAKGFKVVHMRAKAPAAPLADYDAELKPKLAKLAAAVPGKPNLVPFYGAQGLMKQQHDAPPVTALSPPPRDRMMVAAADPTRPRAAAAARRTAPQLRGTLVGGWAARVRREPRVH